MERGRKTGYIIIYSLVSLHRKVLGDRCLGDLFATVVSNRSKPLKPPRWISGGWPLKIKGANRAPPVLLTPRDPKTKGERDVSEVEKSAPPFHSHPPCLPPDSNVSPRLRKSTTVKESKSKRRSGGNDSSKGHSQHQNADPSRPAMAEEFPPEDVNVLTCVYVGTDTV
jgi:hypothetical protein